MNLSFSDLEKDIFVKLLEQASDELSNNGCNDYPIQVTDENREELREFIIAFSEDKEHEEHLLRQLNGKEVYFQDWMILDYLKREILVS